MLFSDLRYDYVRTGPTRLDDAVVRRHRDVPRSMIAEGRRAHRRQRRADAEVAIARAADMRYVGQEHSVTSTCRCGVRRAGPRRIKRVSTTCICSATAPARPNEPRRNRQPASTVTADAQALSPKRRSGSSKPPTDGATAPAGVYFTRGHGFIETPIFHRERAARRQPHRGAGTDRGTCLHHRAHARPYGRVDRFGNLAIKVGKE